MKSMVGMSLDERCAVIKQRFKDTHVSIHKLRKLYREEKIRKKVVRFTKLPSRAEQKRIKKAKKELEQGLS